MTNIRRALPNESQILTDIAAASEAYWGYDVNFMESFRSLYRVTEEFIDKNPTYVIGNDSGIIGFYSLAAGENETSLEYLYVEPKSIGKGYGRVLWNHMIETCSDMGIKKIVFVTSPQAREFYIKMGAVLIGEVDSLVIKNRKIPQLAYTIEV